MIKSEQPKHFHVVGRLRGITPKRLEALVALAGGSLTRSIRAADVIVFAHSAVLQCLDGQGSLAPRFGTIADKLTSERSFMTLVGRPEKSADGTYHETDLARISNLPPEAIRCLALFDIFEGFSNGYTFADLGVSKRVSRWLSEGYSLREVISALLQASRRGDPIGSIELARVAGLRIGTIRNGMLGDLNGQFLLPFQTNDPDIEGIFQGALEAEEANDFHAAARLYEQALRIDPSDPVIHFNYGNVLSELEDVALAEVAYRKALALEPAFSEAWFNIALLAEARGLLGRAKDAYQRAVASDPTNSSAKFNLARMLTSERSFAECIPMWDDLAKGEDPDSRMEARRWATLCRMELKQQQ